MPTFARTIGIDYSGAETPTASLKKETEMADVINPSDPC